MIAKRKAIKKVNISHNVKIETKSVSNQGTKELMLNHISNNKKIPNLPIWKKKNSWTPSWGKETREKAECYSYLPISSQTSE